MARIRSTKPEFWTSEQVMECSPITRLMFLGMWNFADDLGRLPLSPKTIKAQIFPSDNITPETILGMVQELSHNGLVLIYTVAGKDYLQITGWQHQRIDKPQPGKYPAPVTGYSKTIPGMVETERKGEEGKGEDKNPEANASGADAPPDPSEPEREFFRRGKQVLGKSAGGQLAKLLSACGRNVSLARSKIELAATKDNAAAFVAGVIRAGPVTTAKPLTAHQQEREIGRGVLDDIGNFIGGSSQADFGILRHDSSNGPEGLRGRPGGNLIELSPSSRRESG
jgi:hypothetical protein